MPAHPIFPYAPPLTFVPNIPLAPQIPQTQSVTDITAGVSQVTLEPTPNVPTNCEPTSVLSTPTNTSPDFKKAEAIQANVNELFASVPASNSSPSLIESFTAPSASYAQYAGGIQQHVAGKSRQEPIIEINLKNNCGPKTLAFYKNFAPPFHAITKVF